MSLWGETSTLCSWKIWREERRLSGRFWRTYSSQQKGRGRLLSSGRGKTNRSLSLLRGQRTRSIKSWTRHKAERASMLNMIALKSSQKAAYARLYLLQGDLMQACLMMTSGRWAMKRLRITWLWSEFLALQTVFKMMSRSVSRTS